MLNRLNISNLPAIPRKEIFERSFATRVEVQGAWNKSKTSSPEVLPRGKKKKKERKKERKRTVDSSTGDSANLEKTIGNSREFLVFEQW